MPEEMHGEATGERAHDEYAKGPSAANGVNPAAQCILSIRVAESANLKVGEKRYRHERPKNPGGVHGGATGLFSTETETSADDLTFSGRASAKAFSSDGRTISGAGMPGPAGLAAAFMMLARVLT